MAIVYHYSLEIYPLLRELDFLKRFPKAIDVACFVHETFRDKKAARLLELGIYTTDDFLKLLNENNPGAVRVYQGIDEACVFPDYTTYLDVMEYFGIG